MMIFYPINNLDPGRRRSGGGSGVYNSGHEAIVGIQPPAPTTFDHRHGLYADVTPFGRHHLLTVRPFSVSTNIINKRTGNLPGDFCAAIFDDSSNFIDYLETKTAYSLAPGNAYNANLFFRIPVYTTVLPQRCRSAFFIAPPAENG